MANETYTYNKHQVLSFAKTTGRFGGLSNMAPDFVLFVNEINVPSAESLYQACKFSFYPEIQRLIIEERNPMAAKLISRQYQAYVRTDWDQIKISVMEWCLKLKLLQNWEKFGALLRESGTSVIVEYSTKDDLWGAVPKENNVLVGQNVLGRLLMKVRTEYVIPNIKPQKMLPPNVIGLMLYGVPITEVYAPEYYIED
ncbi:MAG: NADAR family protein [Muribaculaceae bacterium]|nr:NADAR family protein [Muribaculaceae bacterium]